MKKISMVLAGEDESFVANMIAKSIFEIVSNANVELSIAMDKEAEKREILTPEFMRDDKKMMKMAKRYEKRRKHYGR